MEEEEEGEGLIEVEILMEAETESAVDVGTTTGGVGMTAADVEADELVEEKRIVDFERTVDVGSNLGFGMPGIWPTTTTGGVALALVLVFLPFFERFSIPFIPSSATGALPTRLKRPSTGMPAANTPSRSLVGSSPRARAVHVELSTMGTL